VLVKTKVAHLSSHHNILDNRIFYRECRSLAAAGYEVVLVAQHDHDEIRDGIRIRAVPRHRNRLKRVTVTAFRVVLGAWREKPAVFHLHDPELIPWGALLRLLGRRVIYDVHEDFTQAADVRTWVPNAARWIVARFSDFIAWLARRTMAIVIAERYYERRFPGATKVLNYPHLERSAALQQVDRRAEARPKQIRLLYVGNVTWSRGAFIHAELAQRLPGVEILISGSCDPAVAAEIERKSGDATIGLVALDGSISWKKRSSRPAAETSTIILDGVGFYVPHERMLDALSQEWTAGIAVFPYTDHYYEQEVTKLFEYMAAGLPLILSHFPNWRALIEDPRTAGIAVDPADWTAIIAAIRRLHENPGEAVSMGLAGRMAVKERFNWQSQADNLVALYARVLGQRPPTDAIPSIAAGSVGASEAGATSTPRTESRT
jgi:glycosyltransferase involved in cell wall biosynthesis